MDFEEVEVNPDQKCFCHQCRREIFPKMPDFLCPLCEGGFLEHMEQTNEDANEDISESDRADVDGASGEYLFASNSPHVPNFQRILSQLFSPGNNHVFVNHQSSSDAEPNSNNASPGNQEYPRRTRSQQRPHREDRLNSNLEENADMTNLQTFLHALLENTIVPAGSTPLMFNVMHGNPGDYAWGPGGLDDIVTQLLNSLDNPGPPPGDKEAIEKLPVVTITQQHLDQKMDCAVCKEEFRLDDDAKELPCNHLFHIDCIKPWLEMHNTCPICRETIPSCQPQTGNSNQNNNNPSGSGGGGGGGGPRSMNFSFSSMFS